MEGVRVNEPSVGEPKLIQTPLAWKKGKNRMIRKKNLAVITLAFAAGVSTAFAQTPPVLGLHLYAGLSITGAVGTV